MNPVPVEEARGWLAALVTTLLGDPYDDDFARRAERWSRNWIPERTWGYRDNGRWVATLATEPRTLTVPGPAGGTRDVEADALTGVSVAATHRRRGLLTSMLTRSLQEAKERGDALSILIAAEWPIYGRFGYAPAVNCAEFTYHPRRRLATLPAAPVGTLRQIEPDEMAKIAPDVFDAARRRRPGQVDRRGSWWERRLAVNGYEAVGKRPHWILHEGPHGPDGLLAWRTTQDFDLSGRLGHAAVEEFVAANDDAYLALWQYLGALDVIEQISFDCRPVDEPVRWLLSDARALQLTAVYDHLWVRLLDVPAALSARSYAVDGHVVLDVVDPETGGYGAGRFALDAEDGTAGCTPTSEPADLRITQRALAAAYLGGYRLRQLALDGVEELTPGALQRADLMFSVPLAPWNQTGF